MDTSAQKQPTGASGGTGDEGTGRTTSSLRLCSGFEKSSGVERGVGLSAAKRGRQTTQALGPTPPPVVSVVFWVPPLISHLEVGDDNLAYHPRPLEEHPHDGQRHEPSLFSSRSTRRSILQLSHPFIHHKTKTKPRLARGLQAGEGQLIQRSFRRKKPSLQIRAHTADKHEHLG